MSSIWWGGTGARSVPRIPDLHLAGILLPSFSLLAVGQCFFCISGGEFVGSNDDLQGTSESKVATLIAKRP